MRFARLLCVFLFLALGVRSVSAFALLGPFAPWMTAQLSYQDGGYSIGGPMNIGEGYRWNVPVITYGFDQSFLDYFGTNGVAAVESAIQILNDLPPASQIVLANYPLINSRVNYRANAQNIADLKTYALSLLLEQMGLASPTRYAYSLHDFSIVDGLPNYEVLIRNFDPFTWEPSTNVNGALYSQEIEFNNGNYVINSTIFVGPYGTPISPVTQAKAIGVALDPTTGLDSGDTVADNTPGGDGSQFIEGAGGLFLGLTQDDAGGLSYLLNSNNIALESLILGVSGAGTNASSFVNTALRPGVEKITFQRMDYVSPTQHVFPIITNQYVDSYIKNGNLQQQTLQRVITQPDILFTAQHIGLQLVSRTGTSNWVNNGAPENDGPGVIQPPVVINFNRLGPSLYFASPNYPSTNGSAPVFSAWGSYDNTTNLPVSFPIPAATNTTTVYFLLGNPTTNYLWSANLTEHSWTFSGPSNTVYLFQTSSNMQDWVTLTNINNLGGTFTYVDWIWTNNPQRFFRTVPQ